MVLPQPVFYCMLAVPTLLPLAVLGRLYLTQFSTEALRTASLGLFLCAAATIAVWFLAGGRISPPLEGMGLGVLFKSVLAVSATCLASVVCGLFCVRAYPWVLLWLVPTILLLIVFGVSAWRIFH